MSETETCDTTALATEITMAWLMNPNTRAAADDVPGFLKAVHHAVAGLSDAPQTPPHDDAGPTPVGATTERKSLASPEHIVSMIDGKPYRTLKRHLALHGLTPAEYRARYGLKPDYPMTAPAYSALRRTMAHTLGLGRKPGAKATAPTTTPATAAPKPTATPKPTARSKPEEVATAPKPKAAPWWSRSG